MLYEDGVSGRAAFTVNLLVRPGGVAYDNFRKTARQENREAAGFTKVSR